MAAFERHLRRARLRCGVNLLLECLAVALLAAGAAAAVALALDKAFAFGWVSPWTVGALAALTVVGAALAWLRAMPDRMAVAVMIDERLGLRERFSTALAMASSEEPFALAAREEARRRAEKIGVKGQFPVRPSRTWFAAAGLWAVAAGVLLLMPTLDLRGALARRQARQQEQARLERAQAEVRTLARSVRSSVEKLDDEALAADLADLDKLSEQVKPDEVRRQAIRKLSDAADRLKNKLDTPENQASRQLKDMLKGLRGTNEALTRELSRALARGDFDKAQELTRRLQQAVAEGEIEPDRLDALVKEMQGLSKQLEELADKQDAAEDALQDATGCSSEQARRMAGMSDRELREALKERGLSEQEIEEAMNKLQAARQACRECRGLAEAMERAAGGQGQGLSAEEMAELIDKLGELEGYAAAGEMTEATLEEIEAAIAALGEEGGDGEGLSPAGEGIAEVWQRKLALARSGGTKGSPTGQAWRQPEDDGSKLKPTRDVASPGEYTGQGEMIASWYFKGPQVKGEAKKEFTQAVRAAADRASEAIEDNRIPRRHANAVKEYYEQFNPTGGQPDESP
jgi:hypothetical protein